MKSEYARTSRVENFFNMLLTKYAVSDNLFLELPVTMKKEWEDLVLIDVGSGINRGASYSYSVNIFLYARPKGELQQKNVKVLDRMETLLEKAIKENHDAHYVVKLNWRDADYDSTRNFHYNVINIETTVI